MVKFCAAQTLKMKKMTMVISVVLCAGAVMVAAQQSNAFYSEAPVHPAAAMSQQSYIMQGATKEQIRDLQASMAMEVIQYFTVIDAVSVSLTPIQVKQVKKQYSGISFFDDSKVELSGNGNNKCNGKKKIM